MAMVGRPARAAAHAVSFYIELDGPERAEPSGRPVSHTQLMCIHAIQHTIHTLTSGLAANSAQAAASWNQLFDEDRAATRRGGDPAPPSDDESEESLANASEGGSVIHGSSDDGASEDSQDDDGAAGRRTRLRGRYGV